MRQDACQRDVLAELCACFGQIAFDEQRHSALEKVLQLRLAQTKPAYCVRITHISNAGIMAWLCLLPRLLESGQL